MNANNLSIFVNFNFLLFIIFLNVSSCDFIYSNFNFISIIYIIKPWNIFKCFLRDNTERPITLIENGGTNKLIKSINDINFKEYKTDILLWDGNSSKRINKILSKIFSIKDLL